MLAHPYGHPRVMSSYNFTDPSQGPPADSDGNIISPEISNGQCVNGWVCEHRWPQISHMVKFRNLVNNEQLENWWSNGNNQIAFFRGNKGFIAINAESNEDLREQLQTGLRAGTYCDVITGDLVNNQCTGKSVIVGKNGIASIEILSTEKEGMCALHNEVSMISNDKLIDNKHVTCTLSKFLI